MTDDRLSVLMDSLILAGVYTEAEALLETKRSEKGIGWTVEEYEEWIRAIGI